MMMDDVRVTVTNSLDVPHVAFLGFVGELTKWSVCRFSFSVCVLCLFSAHLSVCTHCLESVRPLT